ncbi:copper amine oxidase N-terminal domain-containing protein [Paenibacillus sp. GM2]|uniref:copper amine oxidase N-terminal domain-containing protein n=1 Tax=Paenibacillus sp. GM2 TaxID=1622070 RepID=UPI000839C9EB|nr:copper amine oxidase N-terminal domain-containing protein [Paenibacillus sp. GM2]
MKKLVKVLLGISLGISVIYLGGSSVTSPVGAAGKQSPVVFGAPKLAVIVNGKKVMFDGGDPVMENGRVQVPLRGVSEALGAEVGFQGKSVSYTKGDKTISLTLGSKVAKVDGKSVTMDTTAKAVKGRTYVPLRFVSENLGEKVSWDKAGNWVWIGEKTILSTDDEQFRMRELGDFSKYYKKDQYLLKNISGIPYEGIKIFDFSQLPLQMGLDFIIYDMYLVKINRKDYIAVRSTANGSPIYHMVENTYVKYRRDATAGNNHGDGTVTNYYPVISTSDKLVSGVYTNVDWENYDLKTADYIGIETIHPDNYIVAFNNPFK